MIDVLFTATSQLEELVRQKAQREAVTDARKEVRGSCDVIQVEINILKCV
jgi:hypothetical protein